MKPVSVRKITPCLMMCVVQLAVRSGQAGMSEYAVVNSTTIPVITGTSANVACLISALLLQ